MDAKMTNKRISISFLFLVMVGFLTACNEEKPIAPRQNPSTSGDQDTSGSSSDSSNAYPMRSEQLYFGEGFSQQLWYDLASQTVVAQCHQRDWDLAFDCRPGVNRVYLNTGRVMQAAITGEASLEDAATPPSSAYRPDHHGGDPDSLALGARIPEDSVCWIDLGYDVDGRTLGKRKLRFEVRSDAYVVEFAFPDGSRRTVDTIRRNPDYTMMTYSLQDRQARQVAPPKDAYDLWFTAYTHIFYAPGFTPYRVSGVLLNNHQTRAYMDTSVADFKAVEAADFQDDRPGEARDAIGYDWKSYNLQEGVYTVYPQQVYFIENNAGHRYALRFEAFYNAEGQRGYPEFAFRRLE